MPSHKYDVGQQLLCFEPDTSKAKVIYLAKILSRAPIRSNVPYYGVHFQGWKGKWDREVPEYLLLEYTEFNRTLKKKIDELVRNVRCRIRRRQRIDQVLEYASICGDDVDWDKIPGIWTGKRVVTKRIKPRLSPTRLTESKASSERTEKLDFDDFDSPSLGSDEDSMQTQYEHLPIHQAFQLILNLPPTLQAADSQSSAGSLGWCSVLQLLQSYVDGFPYDHSSSVLSKSTAACPERAQRILGPAYNQTDQNRLLCADVCVSLRVLFDLNIGLIQNDSVQMRSTNFPNGGRAFGPNQHMPPGIEPLFRYSSPRCELLSDAEAIQNPNLPCLVYPARYVLRLFSILPKLLDGLSMTPCRRAIVSRHLYMLLDYLERTHAFWFSDLTQAPSMNVKNIRDRTTGKTGSESSSSTEPLAQPVDSSTSALRSHRRGICYTSIMNPIKSEPRSSAQGMTTVATTELSSKRSRGSSSKEESRLCQPSTRALRRSSSKDTKAADGMMSRESSTRRLHSPLTSFKVEPPQAPQAKRTRLQSNTKEGSESLPEKRVLRSRK